MGLREIRKPLQCGDPLFHEEFTLDHAVTRWPDFEDQVDRRVIELATSQFARNGENGALNGRTVERYLSDLRVGLTAETYLLKRGPFIDNREEFNDLFVIRDWVMDQIHDSDHLNFKITFDHPDEIVDGVPFVRVEVKSVHCYGGYPNSTEPEWTKTVKRTWAKHDDDTGERLCRANFFIFYEHSDARDRWTCKGLHYVADRWENK